MTKPRRGNAPYELRRYNRHQVEALLNGYLRLPFYQLKDIFEDDNMPGLDRLVVSVIVKAVEAGDHMKLEAILRMSGVVFPKEVPEEVISIDQMPLAEAIELGRKAILALEQEASQ